MSGDPRGDWFPCRLSDPSFPLHQPGNQGWRLDLWKRNKLKIKIKSFKRFFNFTLFGQWITDVEIFLIEIQHFDSNFQRIVGLQPLLRSSIDCNLETNSWE